VKEKNEEKGNKFVNLEAGTLKDYLLK